MLEESDVIGLRMMLRPAPVFPSGFHAVKQPGTTGFRAMIAVVSTGAATGIRIARHWRTLAKRSVSAFLEPGQSQPLYNSKDHRGRNTKYVRSVCLLQCPSNRHGFRATTNDDGLDWKKRTLKSRKSRRRPVSPDYADDHDDEE
jgi:hypothetical protein